MALLLAVLVAGLTWAADAQEGAVLPLKWEAVDKPGSRGEIVLKGSEINHIATGGDVVYAVDTANSKLHRSGNGGGTFTDITRALKDAGAQLPAHEIAVAPGMPQCVAVSDSVSKVYWSNDSGATWNNTGFPTLTAPETIQCIAISNGYLGNGSGLYHDLAIGTAAWGDTATGQIWTVQVGKSIPSWQPQSIGLPGADVSAIAFSPKYKDDSTILAVASTGSATYLHIGARDLSLQTTTWNNLAGYPVWIQPSFDAPGEHISSSIALPSDYSGTDIKSRMVFVRCNATLNSSANDVYRIYDNLSPQVMRLKIANGVGIDLSSVAYYGTVKAGKLLAGGADPVLPLPSFSVNLWRTTINEKGDVLWIPSTQPPTGPGNAHVAWRSSGTAFCATGQVPAEDFDESAFSRSSDDGDTWEQTSLINTLIRMCDIAPSPDSRSLFMATFNNFGPEGVWRSVGEPIGTYWTRLTSLRTFSDMVLLRLSPDYSNDDTIYAVEARSDNQFPTNQTIMAVSQNRGNTWKKSYIPGPVIDMVAASKDTLYMALPDGYIRKSTDGGLRWGDAVMTGLDSINMLALATNGHLFAGSMDSQVAYSTDNGTSFIEIIDPIGDNTAFVQVVADANYRSNNIIYASTSTDHSSTRDYVATVNVSTDPAAKAITTFTIPSQVGPTIIDESAHTIALTMPFGTNVAALVPNITITGVSISPASGVAHSFPQIYTVTASNSSTQAYAVTVNIAGAITAFTIPSQVGSTTINESTHKIALTMPFGTNVAALVSSFTTTGTSVAVGATPQTSGTTPNDFTSTLTYTVTAADSSTQAYFVTINIAGAITAFTIPSQAGSTVINESIHTIALTMPSGTIPTALVATFTTTGSSVAVGATPQTSGTTPNDFTSTVTYIVTAGASTQAYTVTVTVAAAPKAITAFTFNGLIPAVIGVVNEGARTIALTVPFGTPMNLVPTITLSGGTVSPLSGVANNFTTPQTYTVTGADSLTRTYVVRVYIAAAPKSITAFNFNGLTTPVIGVINEDARTVALNVPFGTAVTTLVPTIKISTGSSVNPASLVANNFTTPQTYTVTAADDTGKVVTDKGVWRRVIDQSTEWEQIDEEITALNPGQIISGLMTGPEGTLYALRAERAKRDNRTVPADNYTGTGGMNRTLNPTANPVINIEWDIVNRTLVDAKTAFDPCPLKFTSNPPWLKLSGNSSENDLWAIDTANLDVADDTAQIYRFRDNLCKVGPWIEGPAEVGSDPVSGRNQQVDLAWEQLSLTDRYELQVAKDLSFNLRINPEMDSADNIWSVIGSILMNTDEVNVTSPAVWLAPGSLPEAGAFYYWRIRCIRAATWEFIRSPWSDTARFMVKPGYVVNTPYVGPQLLSPEDGCGCPYNTPVSFSWSPYKEATKYKFEFSENADMSRPVVSANLMATAYRYGGQLQYGKSYFWRVMEVEPVPGDWSATFSFKAQPAPQPAQAPAQRSGAAPLWAWIVMAVGTVTIFVQVFILLRQSKIL